MKRLSVIIPGYNTPEAWWERCLKSVCAACGPEDEIICVDDGSARRPEVGAVAERGEGGGQRLRLAEDELSSPVDAFVSNAFDGTQLPTTVDFNLKSQPQIKWLYLEKNSGQAVARNRALEIAEGKYVTFVDSDDTVEPEVYARSIVKLESSDADVCLFGVRCLWPTEGLVKHDVPAACEACVPSAELVETWYRGCVLNYIANKVVRKGFLDEHRLRIDPDGMPCEDVMFFLETLIAGAKWCAIDYEGYNYWRNADTSLAHYKPFHRKGTMACAATWARFCATQEDGVRICGHHARLTPKEMALSEWENIWRGGSIYSLPSRYKWLKDHASDIGGNLILVFIKQFIKSFIRQHLYFIPIRRRHYMSIYANIETTSNSK